MNLNLLQSPLKLLLNILSFTLIGIIVSFGEMSEMILISVLSNLDLLLVQLSNKVVIQGLSWAYKLIEISQNDMIIMIHDFVQ